VPPAPDTTLIQLTSLLAVHAQPAEVVTVTTPGSDAEVWGRLVVESSYVQPGVSEGEGEGEGEGVGAVGTRSVQAVRLSIVSDAHASREQARSRGNMNVTSWRPTMLFTRYNFQIEAPLGAPNRVIAWFRSI
jgi:hypothetical protein